MADTYTADYGSAYGSAYAGVAQVLIAWSTSPFSGSPVWTDVTPWIRLDAGIRGQRGRQDNITSIQHGAITLTADNSDGRFTAGRSGSPWAPDVKIGRRIQVNVPDETGTLHTRFDGLITELPTKWQGGPGIVSLEEIQASDVLGWLARQPQLLSWTQQEMLADNPLVLYSLADSSAVTQAVDQAGQGAAPLQVISQGDGTGQAAAGSGVPLAEVRTSSIVAQQQQVQTFTFTNPGSFNVTFPAGTLVKCDVVCVAGGKAAANGGGAGAGGTGGNGGEYAEEPNLAVTPGDTYSGSVGAAGVPPSGTGGDTTFTGDSATVTAHGAGSGSTNTIHNSGGTGAAAASSTGGGGASSGGVYQGGNHGVSGSLGGAAGAAVTGGGAGGAGDSGGTGGAPGAAPGGGGGGGLGSATTPSAGGPGGAGSCTITYTYIPPPSSQTNSALPSWLFVPSVTLAARILSGALPQPVTAAGGFAFEVWGEFAAFPANSVTTVTTAGAFTWPCPPGIITADAACMAGGKAGTNGSSPSGGGTGGNGGEYAEEPSLAVTPNSIYSGSVGAAGAPSGGTGGDTTFTGDSVTVAAHGAGTGSSNTIHHDGGAGGTTAANAGGGGGSSGGPYQAGNKGIAGSLGGAAGAAVTGGGAGGAGDGAGPGAAPGAAPGGGGGGGLGGSTTSAGASGGAGQAIITAKPAASTLLTLVNPRGQAALAIWVTSGGHLQLASTSQYGTRNPAWTTVDAGQVPTGPFHVAVTVAAATRIATVYVNDVSAGTVTLPAGAAYSWLTAGGAYGAWLGGWAGSAGLAAVYPAALSPARIGVHYTAGTTGFAGSSTGTMIAKIAAYVGLPSFWYAPPSGPSDPSYGLTTVSYYDLNGQQPLTQMQLYETAEAGVLYIGAAGQLIFSDRATRYEAGAAAAPAFVLQAGQYEPDTSFKSNDQYLCTAACYSTTDIPGGYPVSNPAAKLDFGTYTQNAGTPTSPAVAPFSDATSTAGVYSTDDLMDAGWWQANAFGAPVSRVPSLTIDLLTLPPSEFSIAAFYACEIGSVIQLAGLPSQAPDNTGQALSGYQVIEGINETITLDSHTAELYTSPLSQNAAWIPGDTLLGVLGSTNTVGRSASPAASGAPYPVPTFGAGLNRTGSAGAQDWRGLTVNVQARLTPPLAIGQQANAQTLTTLTGQPVTFDTALADTAGGLKTISTYTVQAGYPGYYWCAAVVQAATGITNLTGIAAWFAAVLSGVASQWHARAIPYLSTAPYTAIAIAGRIGPCAAGDTIQVITAAAYTTPPASVPLGTADGGSMFTLFWQGD